MIIKLNKRMKMREKQSYDGEHTYIYNIYVHAKNKQK